MVDKRIHANRSNPARYGFSPLTLSVVCLNFRAALGTGIGLGVVSAGRVVTGSRGLIEGGHMVRYHTPNYSSNQNQVWYVDKRVCLICFSIVGYDYISPPRNSFTLYTKLMPEKRLKVSYKTGQKGCTWYILPGCACTGLDVLRGVCLRQCRRVSREGLVFQCTAKKCFMYFVFFRSASRKNCCPAAPPP